MVIGELGVNIGWYTCVAGFYGLSGHKMFVDRRLASGRKKIFRWLLYKQNTPLLGLRIYQNVSRKPNWMLRGPVLISPRT
jgi:hypothetical protein